MSVYTSRSFTVKNGLQDGHHSRIKIYLFCKNLKKSFQYVNVK